MTDGAHLGVGAERALNTVLGGADQPAADERMTTGQMKDWLLSATKADAATYDGSARYAAKLVLEFLTADPVRASIPTENVYETGSDGRLVFNSDGGLNLVTPGLYDVMKDAGSDIGDLDLTGFMWGWAVNAARVCVELAPVPNPAIVTMRVESS